MEYSRWPRRLRTLDVLTQLVLGGAEGARAELLPSLVSGPGSSQAGLCLPVAPSDLCGVGLPSDEGTDPVTQRTWVQAPGTYPAELDAQEFPLRSSLRLVEVGSDQRSPTLRTAGSDGIGGTVGG